MKDVSAVWQQSFGRPGKFIGREPSSGSDGLRSDAFRYSCAVLAASLAAALRFLLQSSLQDNAPFATFYLASLAVAYYCGTRPAVLTTLLGGLAADYFFIPPQFSLSLYVHHPHDATWLMLYLVDCGVAVVLIRALARAKLSSEDRRRALEKEAAAHMAADADRDRLLALIDLDNDAIITATPQGVISGWSAGAEAMYGWKTAEARGRSFRKLLLSTSELADSIDAALVSAGRWEGEIRGIRNDGTEVIVEAREVLVLGRDGSPEAILKVDHDVTSRKRADDHLRNTQRFETVGVLAGGLAHDINNLMTVVIGNSDLVCEEVESAHAQERLQLVIRAGQRASKLAQQLTAYAGKGALIMNHVDLNELVMEYADLLRSSVPKNQTLNFDLADHLPPLTADASQIQQVIANLVINGAEAIGEAAGSITVRTGCRRIEPEQVDIAGDMRTGDHVYIAVDDTGSGIAPEVKTRIFDPFFSTKFLGRGLGLAAVAGIARSHQGGVSVRSFQNVGSTFTVFFPISRTSGAQVTGEPGGEAESAAGASI